jgi:diguanylate cyclase (GGDEF)-like protein
VNSTMTRPDPLTLGLGVCSLAVGIVASVADLAPLGAVAGVLGMAAGAAHLIVGQPSRPLGSHVAAPTAASSFAPPVGVPAGALKDPLTGLFGDSYFNVVVEARVSAARRHLRPVAVVLFDVFDATGQRVDAQSVAAAIKETLREADTACRLDDGRFAFVLEDTPEDGAIWTVERLRRKLSANASEQTRWAGIACYPAHAFSATEALSKAETAFAAAREWKQDRIEVARPD